MKEQAIIIFQLFHLECLGSKYDEFSWATVHQGYPVEV